MYQDNAPAGPDQETDEASSSRLVDAPAAATDESTRNADGADPRETSHAFRDELARAMQGAAERERQRIESDVDADAAAHIEKVRTRAGAEAAELKRLAEDDVTGIRSWAKSEIERIRSDADTQIDERRDRLEQHLIHHSTIIDGEIDRVSEAVEGYRHELDTFFASLAAEREPSQIARMADTVPGPPDFELIRSIARAEAVERLSELEASAQAPASEPAADDAPAAQAGENEGIASLGAGPIAVTETQTVAVATDDQPSETAEPTTEAAEPTENAEPAIAMASAESAGDATDAEPEMVPVMDPALAEKPADEDAGMPVAVEMAATDGEPAAAEPAAAEPTPEAESPEPVGAASAPDTNPAARFIRSLASWGSSPDHGSNDQSR